MGFKFEPEKKKETLNKTIRFPKELVERIEKEVAENGVFKQKTLSDYIIPTMLDLPKMETEFIDNPFPYRRQDS